MAKQGLNKIWILKDQIGLIWGEPDGRRREEEEEEEKRKEEESIQASQGMETTLSMDACLWYGTWIFGMKTNLDYDFHEIWHVSLGL